MLSLLKFADFFFILLVSVNTFINVDAVAKHIATYDMKPFKPVEQRGIEINFRTITIVDNLTTNTEIARYNGSELADCFSDESGLFANPLTIVYTCPYQKSTVFLTLMGLWAGYYGLCLVIIRTVYAWRFSYDDYRYLLYMDQFNARLPTLIMYLLGVAGSLACGIEGLIALANEGITSPGQIWPPIMFVITNCIGLRFTTWLAVNTDVTIFDRVGEIKVTQLPGGNDFLNVLLCAFASRTVLEGLQRELVFTLMGEPGLSKLTDQHEELKALLVVLMRDPSAAADEPKAAPVAVAASEPASEPATSGGV